MVRSRVNWLGANVPAWLMVYLLASAGKTDHDPFRAPRFPSHFSLSFFFLLHSGASFGGRRVKDIMCYLQIRQTLHAGSAALVLMKNRSRFPGKIKTDKKKKKEAVLYQKFTHWPARKVLIGNQIIKRKSTSTRWGARYHGNLMGVTILGSWIPQIGSLNLAHPSFQLQKDNIFNQSSEVQQIPQPISFCPLKDHRRRKPGRGRS